MTIKGETKFHLALLLAPLLLLPGCWTCEKHEQATVGSGVEDGSPVLMKIDGRSALTLNGVDDLFERFLEANPNVKQMLPYMPDVKLNVFQGMVNQEIINEYIHRNKIDSSDEYQREWAKTIEQIKNVFNMDYFSKRHPAEVSETEARKFYDENKDKIPDFVQSQGGVKTEAVSFTNEEDAKAFLAKAKESRADFAKIATDAGYANNYRDFKLVNAQSPQIDPALKAKIVKMTSFPAMELFNVGNEWWVINAHSSTEPAYVPFDRVKSAIQEHLKKQKQAEVFEKVIDTYKSEYNVEVDDAPLRSKAPAQVTEEYVQDHEELAQVEDMQPVTRTV